MGQCPGTLAQGTTVTSQGTAAPDDRAAVARLPPHSSHVTGWPRNLALMASTAWAGLLLAALASLVTEVGAGGGSGLLLVQGKLGGGTTDWDILIICVAIGRHVTDVCPLSLTMASFR